MELTDTDERCNGSDRKPGKPANKDNIRSWRKQFSRLQSQTDDITLVFESFSHHGTRSFKKPSQLQYMSQWHDGLQTCKMLCIHTRLREHGPQPEVFLFEQHFDNLQTLLNKLFNVLTVFSFTSSFDYVRNTLCCRSVCLSDIKWPKSF